MSSRKKFLLKAATFDKKGRQLSMGFNSYSKTHPLMLYLSKYSPYPNKMIYLHAEIVALLKCKDKVPYMLTVERYNSEGEIKLAEPCAMCKEAMKMWGVSVVRYTTDDGWIEKRLNTN
jgi:tRNA(Arg) A34 adenosine deaminase TadA